MKERWKTGREGEREDKSLLRAGNLKLTSKVTCTTTPSVEDY